MIAASARRATGSPWRQNTPWVGAGSSLASRTPRSYHTPTLSQRLRAAQHRAVRCSGLRGEDQPLLVAAMAPIGAEAPSHGRPIQRRAHPRCAVSRVSCAVSRVSACDHPTGCPHPDMEVSDELTPPQRWLVHEPTDANSASYHTPFGAILPKCLPRRHFDLRRHAAQSPRNGPRGDVRQCRLSRWRSAPSPLKGLSAMTALAMLHARVQVSDSSSPAARAHPSAPHDPRRAIGCAPTDLAIRAVESAAGRRPLNTSASRPHTPTAHRAAAAAAVSPTRLSAEMRTNTQQKEVAPHAL